MTMGTSAQPRVAAGERDVSTPAVTPPANSTPTATRADRPRRARSSRGGWLYLTPVIVVFVMWTYLPMLGSVLISFSDWHLGSGFRGWAGVENYAALFRNGEIQASLVQTVVFAALMLPFATIIPMVLAILLWLRPGRASTVFQALLFLPVMLAPVSHAAAWQLMLNPLNGFLNTILEGFGLPGVNWLGDPFWAPIVVSAVTAARIVATNMLIFTSGLAGIDRKTLAAADIEGATTWEKIRFIVIPQLKGLTIVLGAMSLVLGGQWVFNNVSILTQGGPDGSTNTIYFHIYQLGFEFLYTDRAAAASVLVLLIVFAVFALLQLLRAWSRARIHREEKRP